MKTSRVNKKILPLVILAVLLLLAFIAVTNPPETARKAPSTAPRMTVETQVLESRPYQVFLQSYGTVRPRVQSMLVSQVGGQIVWVNPQFRDGGFFSEGDILLKIDPRDYEADVKIAEANLLDAQQSLAEEQARSAQAIEDWDRLGNQGEAPALVLRKPQLLAAEARVISSESSLTKAQLSLERTRIIAPFDGRVLRKQVDLGQVVTNNSQLVEVYATDYVEIRLPLRNSDLDFIKLPEYAGTDAEVGEEIEVKILSSLTKNRSWKGKLVRTEGAIDESARQLHVVAQIDDPFGIKSKIAKPLKAGEYVTAEIDGNLLPQAIVIPNRTIYQGSYVYLVENGALLRTDIEITWQNESEAIIGAGLSAGDKLVLTPLGQVTSGTRVKTLDQTRPPVAGPPPVRERTNEAPQDSGSEAKKKPQPPLIDAPALRGTGDKRS